MICVLSQDTYLVQTHQFLYRKEAVRHPLLLCLHEELVHLFEPLMKLALYNTIQGGTMFSSYASFLSIYPIPSFLSLTVMLSQYYNLYAPYMLYCPLCHDVRGLHKSLISFMLLTRFTLFTVLSCCVVIAHVTYIYQSIISFIITLI